MGFLCGISRGYQMGYSKGFITCYDNQQSSQGKMLQDTSTYHGSLKQEPTTNSDGMYQDDIATEDK